MSMIAAAPIERAKPFDAKRSIRRLTFAGVACGALLIAGVGGWAATTMLAGAIIAPGRLVVESNVKKVQHPTGGVIGELLVKEGDRVEAGAVLLRLDRTQTLASLAIICQNLDELAARKARDEAERDDKRLIAFSDEMIARDDPRLSRLMSDEQKLLEVRFASRNGQKAQLGEQIAQLGEQSQGLDAELQAKGTEIALNGEELKTVEGLWEQRLVQVNRLTALKRDAARLEGERGRLVASLAEIKGRVAELKLKILQIDEDMRMENGRELAEIRGKISELAEKRIAAEDQLRRIDVRSPQNGYVHQLAVHTVGGVASPGETLMLIVPDNDALAVESRVQPGEIDQVHLGQQVVVRFPGLSQRTTPELDGTVSLVSADSSQDEKSGVAFYTIRVTLPLEQVARLDAVKLVPGMPVESFLQTRPRTVLSFLVQPLRDQLGKALRER